MSHCDALNAEAAAAIWTHLAAGKETRNNYVFLHACVCVCHGEKRSHTCTHTLTLTHMSATAASNVSIIASWMLMHHANAETPQTNCTAASWAHRCRPALPNLLCVRACVCVYLGMHVCRCLCRCVFVDDITLHICLQGHVWSRMCFSQDFVELHTYTCLRRVPEVRGALVKCFPCSIIDTLRVGPARPHESCGVALHLRHSATKRSWKSGILIRPETL